MNFYDEMINFNESSDPVTEYEKYNKLEKDNDKKANKELAKGIGFATGAVLGSGVMGYGIGTMMQSKKGSELSGQAYEQYLKACKYSHKKPMKYDEWCKKNFRKGLIATGLGTAGTAAGMYGLYKSEYNEDIDILNEDRIGRSVKITKQNGKTKLLHQSSIYKDNNGKLYKNGERDTTFDNAARKDNTTSYDYIKNAMNNLNEPDESYIEANTDNRTKYYGSKLKQKPPKTQPEATSQGVVDANNGENPEVNKPSKKWGRIAGRTAATAGIAGGGTAIAISAAKMSKAKKDFNSGKISKEEYEALKKKYKKGIIAGGIAAVGGTAGHIGMSVKSKKALKEDIDFFNYLVSLDEAYYDGYYNSEYYLENLDF